MIPHDCTGTNQCISCKALWNKYMDAIDFEKDETGTTQTNEPGTVEGIYFGSENILDRYTEIQSSYEGGDPLTFSPFRF